MKTLNLIISLLILAAIIGIFAIGIGITGKSIQESQYLKTLCTIDNDCVKPEVCCIFYNKQAGVCDSESMCSTILEITKNSSNNNPIIIDEKPNMNIYNSYSFIGIILLIIIVAYFIYVYNSRKDKKTKKVIKKTVKKKKR